ncbi:MAG: YciI family protein [Flavobacteriales bacterium]
MKSTIILLCILSLIIFSCEPKKSSSEKGVASKDTTIVSTDGYDSLLAKKLGADDYGMKQYVMAYLKKGPDRSQDSTTASELQMAHLNNIMRMADEGKLVVAGPFMDDTAVRGIYIFNTPSVDTAAAWTNTDPAVIAGRLVMELHPWYGSAALLQVNDLHKKIQKRSIAD